MDVKQIGTIIIQDLIMHARLGIDPHELTRVQRIKLDLAVSLDMQRVQHSDDIADTLHYGQLVRALVVLVESKTYAMLETLVYDVMCYLRGEPMISTAEVTVTKLQVGLMGASVSIQQKFVRDMMSDAENTFEVR